MARYEVEVGGARYEIEVEREDQIEAMMAEIAAEQGNSPVTPQQEGAPDAGGGFLSNLFGSLSADDPRRAQMQQQAQQFVDETGAREQEVLQGANAFMQSANDTASMGVTPLLQRHIGAAADDVGSSIMGTNPEMGYGDFLERIDQERAQRVQNNPRAAMAGGITGSVVGGAATGAGMMKLPMMAAQGLPGVLARLGGGAALGAGEGLAVEGGRGNLTAENVDSIAGWGALAGAGGQALGELAAPVGRFLSGRLTQRGAKEAAKRKVASSLMDDAQGQGSIAAATNRGRGYTEADLADMADSTGGPTGRMFGEYNDRMLELTGQVASQPENVGRVGPLSDMAGDRLREIDARTGSLLEDALMDPNRVRDPAAFAARQAERQAEASRVYGEIFDSPAGRSVEVINKANVFGLVRNATDAKGNPVFDPKNMTASSKAALNSFEKQLKAVGLDGQEGLTMAGLQRIKMDLDDDISRAWNQSATSSDKVSSRELIAMKNTVNKIMQDTDPRYADASTEFADVKAIERAGEMGRKLVRGTNTTSPIEEVQGYMATLTQPERIAAQDSAMTWLRGEASRTNTQMNRLAKDNPDMRQRLTAIFGQDVDFDSLSDAAASLKTQREQYEALAKVELQGVSQSIPKPQEDSVGGLIDLASMAAGLRPGQGTPVSSTRRAVTRLLRGDPSEVNKTLLDLLQSATPEQSKEIIESLLRARNAPNARMTGAVAGSAVNQGLMAQ